MESQSDGGVMCNQITYLNDLPDEILDHIFSRLSPYRDFKSAMLVCKRWLKIMRGVPLQVFQNFNKAIMENNLEWFLNPVPQGPILTERYSHSACYHGKSVYVYGGCTSSQTTFNDLWRLDLATRQWIRPLATGVYPSPKACASMVAYEDNLILFGGWSHPTPYPLHQAARFFNQLHVYHTVSCRWTDKVLSPAPPGKAGHAATVLLERALMVVFGGSHGLGLSCNDVWVLDLVEFTWHKRDITGPKPLPRYGHSQVALDSSHLLVIGGCGGPNQVFTDVWLLSLDTDVWTWTELKVLQPDNCPPQLWCHPACKVGDSVVVLSKTNRPVKLPPPPPPPPLPAPGGKKVVLPPRGWGPESGAGSHTAQAAEGASGASGGSAAGEDEDLGVGRVSLRVSQQVKRSLPETSGESSSQESSSDQDDIPNTNRRSSYRQFKLPNSPPRSSNRGYSWPSSKAGQTKMAELSKRDQSPEGAGRDPSPVSEYVNFKARSKTRSEEASKSLSRSGASFEADCESDDCACPSTSSSAGSVSKDSKREDAAAGGGASLSASSSSHDLELSSCKPFSMASSPRAGLPSVRPNAMKNRQKQLETLKKYEEKLRNKSSSKPGNSHKVAREAANSTSAASRRHQTQHPMFVHVMDVSRALSELTVTWLPISEYPGREAPEETIFYSLVEGRGELVMVGGIQTDLNSMQKGLGGSVPVVVSNSAHFLQAKQSLC